LRPTCRQYGIRYIPDERPEGPASLVQTVWPEHPVLLHNECDHLFFSKESINLLKVLHEEPREIKYRTKEAEQNQHYLDKGSVQYHPAIAPSRFPVGWNCRHCRCPQRTLFQARSCTLFSGVTHYVVLPSRPSSGISHRSGRPLNHLKSH
jgi:hypothetical protein